MKKGIIWVGILAMVFMPLAISGCGEELPHIERSLRQFTINQGGISGSFFLGCGSISAGEKKYYFYYKTAEGNKSRPASVDLNKSSIVEDGQNKVVFVPYNSGNLFYNPATNDEVDSGDLIGVQEFEFHIPPGSILETYDPNFSPSR